MPRTPAPRHRRQRARTHAAAAPRLSHAAVAALITVVAIATLTGGSVAYADSAAALEAPHQHQQTQHHGRAGSRSHQDQSRHHDKKHDGTKHDHTVHDGHGQDGTKHANTDHQGPGNPGSAKPGSKQDSAKPDGADTDPHGATSLGQPGLSTSVDPGRDALAASQLGATAAPLTPYEMPFPCGEIWTGTSRPDHTPSPRAVDWNASSDLGRPVVAAAGGTVTTAVVGVNLPSYGQHVIIDHGNGESTLYGHLDSVTVVVGQVVVPGVQIGTLGDTGHSTGPHLHFEERLNGVDQDVWLHGAPYPMGVPAASTNCGAAPPPVTTIPTPPTTTLSVRQVPLAGNLIGTSPAETVVFKKRRASWFKIERATKPPRKVQMGSGDDQPVLGDWDGNGKANPGIRRPTSRTFVLRVHGRDQQVRFGQPHDLPIAGNWDGSGGWEVGVRKARSGTFKLRADDGSVTRVSLGDADDLPVTGDWDGDGVTDLGVYDATTSTFTLRFSGSDGVVQQTQVAFGIPGDRPVAGDWNGDGVTDVGVWDPRTRQFDLDTAPRPAGSGSRQDGVEDARVAGIAGGDTTVG